MPSPFTKKLGQQFIEMIPLAVVAFGGLLGGSYSLVVSLLEFGPRVEVLHGPLSASATHESSMSTNINKHADSEQIWGENKWIPSTDR